MKKVLYCTLVSMLCLITLFSCNKEETTTGIYAPNNLLVSESMTDLTNTIANSIDMDTKNVSIESISFLEVEKGFIADVKLYISTTDEHTSVYYISPLLKDQLSYDGSIEVAEVATARSGKVPEIVDGAVSFCSCGNTSTPSSGCIISGRLAYDGTIILRCLQTSCTSFCVLQSQ